MGWILSLGGFFSATWGATDTAEQLTAGIVAGVRDGSAARLVYNKITNRLEVRDVFGNLLEEISAGSVGRAVDVAGQEYRLSFGMDEMAQPSVLVRPGPAMVKPLVVVVFGKTAVLSPDASLVVTLLGNGRVALEPSICGQVYYIDDHPSLGRKQSRLASSPKEIVKLFDSGVSDTP